MTKLSPEEIIQNKIYVIRGQRVMIDSDLASLYKVSTKNLNKAVNRNLNRFPKDFMFQLSDKEFNFLRFQFGTSNQGGRRYIPYVFTEQGIAMLSSVLKSKKAIQINILIMRMFVRLRHMLSTHKNILEKLNKLEHSHNKHDTEIQTLFNILKKILNPPVKPKQKIGFIVPQD